jgi:signal transduction histidine kinase
MTLQGLGILALFVALLALALLVLINNPRAPVNRRFSFASLAIAGWIVSIYVALFSQDQTTTIWLGRLGFAFASLIPYTLLFMFHAFADASRDRRSLGSLLPGIFCAVFVTASLSPWIVAGSIATGPRVNFLYGPLHTAFGLYFIACFLLALFTLAKTISSSSGLRRLQLLYLLLGILLGGIGAITTNLLIPLISKTSAYSGLGPYFSLLVVSFSAHAIIRHRLMNIRLVVRRGIVYLIAAGVAGGVFAVILATLPTLIGGRRQDLPFGTQVIVALAIALAFQPLKDRIQGSLDRYLYRETYNYQQIIREASRTIGSTLDLATLLNYVSDVVKRTCHPDLVAVFVRDSENLSFRLATRLTFGDITTSPLDKPIDSDGALTTFLETSRRPLFRDELGRSQDRSSASEAAYELFSLGGDVALPMFSEHQLVGFILLGPKLSGDAYFNEDVGLLSTLANQAAIAIKNAQLYRQVVVVNEYIENILRTMDSGVVTIDALGKVALSNSTAERLVSIPRDLLTRLSVEELPSAIAVQLKATLLDGRPRLQTEATLQGPSDRRTHLVCSSSALSDDRGTVIGAVIVFSDVSNVKALENEKRRAERLASFGTLVAGIAHEIKNPLVAIKTFAELLPERYSDEEFRGDFSAVVIGEIDRIDGLVGRLRSLAAPELEAAGAIDIREPILETLSLLRAQFEQTRTTVHHALGASSLLVAIDPTQIKQLFLNLCLNAVEAMGHGGQLEVKSGTKQVHGQWWVDVTVTDKGPGVPDAIRSKIFEPFFSTKARGSGLGLAICRSITDAHRGTIAVQAGEHGEGTSVVVTFPAASSVPGPAPEHVLSA